MTHTLAEVAELTGRTEATLRKHIERGRLTVTSREGNKALISDDDLDRYLTAEELDVTAGRVRDPENSVPQEVGNMFSRLPPRVTDAILAGLPTSKSGGSGEAFRKATKNLPRQKGEPPRLAVTDDPHFGLPVGFTHVDNPRWKRTSESTWSLDGATFSWNGMDWEGGGAREGVILGEKVSPADPDFDRRPMAPSKVVAVPKGKK